MKFYPYSKIESERLGLVLFAARAITIIGITIFTITFIIAAWKLFEYGIPPLSAPDGFYRVQDDIGLPTIIILAIGFASFVICTLIGGIAASLVAIESRLSLNTSYKALNSPAASSGLGHKRGAPSAL